MNGYFQSQDVEIPWVRFRPLPRPVVSESSGLVLKLRHGGQVIFGYILADRLTKRKK